MTAKQPQQSHPLAEVFSQFVLSLVRISLEQIEAEREDRPEASGPGLLGREEAAAYLAIGVTSLDALRDAGELIPITLPGMKWPKYVRKDLDRYIEKLRKEQRRGDNH